MRKKEYIQKAKNAILNRVKFHAPVVFDDKINHKVLASHGVDIKKPVFKFEKPLNKNLLKAFKLALQEADFNLVVSSASIGKSRTLKDFSNVVVYDPENSSNAFLESVNKLNINYVSASNYEPKFKERFFKINEQILNPHFDNFALSFVGVVNEINISYAEFVLNGNNFFCELSNKTKNERRVEVELNIPLPKGYFYFKQLPKTVQIENLLTKQKRYLNYTCKNAKFCFSNVDGLENSTFCCVNLKFCMSLKPNEQNFVFINFGDNKFTLKTLGEIEKWQKLSVQKCYEIFDVKVKSKNPDFDYFFNKTLPQKIWIEWLNGKQDALLEQKYLTYKRLFVRGTLKNSYENIIKSKSTGHKQNALGINSVNFKEIGLRELGIFNGQYYKKIFIVKGDERFLRVGKTFFYNINGITQHSLKSKEPISLCFGQK